MIAWGDWLLILDFWFDFNFVPLKTKILKIKKIYIFAKEPAGKTFGVRTSNLMIILMIFLIFQKSL
jgi:hypothetical protein